MKFFIAISSFLFASSAFSFPSLQNVKDHFVTKESTVHAKKVECADFTGWWDGECTTTEAGRSTTETQSKKIQQDGCSRIVVGDELMEIGAAVTKVETRFKNGDYGSTTSHPVQSWSQSIDWDNTRKTLLLDGSLLMSSTDKSHKTQVMRFTGNLKLDGERLLESMIMNGLNISCTYSRH